MKRSGYRGFTRITSAPQAGAAFTLIELLVVIAIIAILAAILFPVFAQAREKARQTSCLSNEKQISLGILSYNEDYDETYPQALDNSWDDPWSVEITPYIKSVQVFHCPDDPNSPAIPAGDQFAAPNISYVVNAAFQWNPETGVNAFSGLFYPTADLNGSGLADAQVRSLASVTFPSSTVMVAERDNVYPNACGGGNAGTLYYWGRSWVGSGWTGYECDGGGNEFGPTQIPQGNIAPKTNPYDPTGPNGGVMAVHSGMANFAFADGHVKAMRPAATNPNNFQAGNAGNMWISTRSRQ